MVPQLVAAVTRSAPPGMPAPGALAEGGLHLEEVTVGLHQFTDAVTMMLGSPRLKARPEVPILLPVGVLLDGMCGKRDTPSRAACLQVVATLLEACADETERITLVVMLSADCVMQKIPSYICSGDPTLTASAFNAIFVLFRKL